MFDCIRRDFIQSYTLKSVSFPKRNNKNKHFDRHGCLFSECILQKKTKHVQKWCLEDYFLLKSHLEIVNFLNFKEMFPVLAIFFYSRSCGATSLVCRFICMLPKPLLVPKDSFQVMSHVIRVICMRNVGHPHLNQNNKKNISMFHLRVLKFTTIYVCIQNMYTKQFMYIDIYICIS